MEGGGGTRETTSVCVCMCVVDPSLKMIATKVVLETQE